MGKVIRFHEARASAASGGYKSGRSSSLGTPVSRSIGRTNSAGTPRLDFSSQYQTCDCVVPIRSAKGFCPPARSHARLSASVDMGPEYRNFGDLQQKSLLETIYRNFGSLPPMKRKVNKAEFGGRVARRRRKLGLSQTEVGIAIGMKQQGIDSIESGKVSRPRLLRELAAALQTTEEWLLWGEGEEESPEPDRDEALAILRRLKPARRKLALRMLKAMEDEEIAA